MYVYMYGTVSYIFVSFLRRWLSMYNPHSKCISMYNPMSLVTIDFLCLHRTIGYIFFSLPRPRWRPISNPMSHNRFFAARNSSSDFVVQDDEDSLVVMATSTFGLAVGGVFCGLILVFGIILCVVIAYYRHKLAGYRYGLPHATEYILLFYYLF